MRDNKVCGRDYFIYDILTLVQVTFFINYQTFCRILRRLFFRWLMWELLALGQRFNYYEEDAAWSHEEMKCLWVTIKANIFNKHPLSLLLVESFVRDVKGCIKANNEYLSLLTSISLIHAHMRIWVSSIESQIK